MTVKELIEKLQAMPQDANVVHINWHWSKNKAGYSNPTLHIAFDGSVAISCERVGDYEE